MSHIAALEPGNRVQLPPDWAQAAGQPDFVSLERTADNAIVIRPVRRMSWSEIFADKLPMGPSRSALGAEQDVEVEPDDLLF